MKRSRRSAPLGVLVVTALILAACTPAAQPSPTTAPAKPAPTTAPAKQETKPAATTAPAKAAPTQAAKQEAKPAASPAAKAAFDEKAVADFYRGKTVRIVVGFSPGGGYDAYSRLIARHIGKHIPGNPNVIVENVPGAGSMLAMNQIYNTLPKDGTVIGNVAGGLVLQQLTGAQGVEYDSTKANYLGAPNYFEYLMIVTKRSGFTSVDQAMGPNAKQIVIGTTGVGSGSYNTTMVTKEALDLNMRVVTGYEGSSNVRLAMESGEVDGYFNSWDSAKSTFSEQMKSGDFLTLAQLVEGTIKDLPQVPHILTYAKTDEQKQLLRYGIFLPNRFARPYVLAPDVPADRLRALQQAFQATMNDEAFRKEAEQAQQDVNPITGDQLKEEITAFLAMPEAVKTRLVKIFQPSS